MNRQATRSSRLLAGVLALALASVSAATCLAAVVQMSEKHHACCEAMGHCSDGGGDSETTPAKIDCCAVQSAEAGRLATGAQAITVAASLLAESPVVEPSSFAPISATGAFDPGVPKPSSSPTYLLVSSFRI